MLMWLNFFRTGFLPTAMPLFRYCISLAFVLMPAVAFAAEPINFSRDIRPILSNHCYKCHGPAVQKGKLRLDIRDQAIAKQAIVPGKPGESELITRITRAETDESCMPPREAGERLTPDQVARLKLWIDQGATYSSHWAFQAPTRPVVPLVHDAAVKVRNPIDAFIVAELQKHHLVPSPEAEKTTLIRRVTLDLTGLLPTPQEVDAYLQDSSPEAYEKVVDRLLASPHYGERQARHWLDLARYADSNGYTIDGPRTIWPYRDWVISSLNADMPFDQFTIEQLAGDLLPGSNLNQKIATGFHRNTSFNEEGGTDPEQFRVERTIDRTNTTGAVWLGLTVGCAQCHDHKYDPLPQRDYYSLYAFFDSCDESTLPISGRPDLEETIAALQVMRAYTQKTGDGDGFKAINEEIRQIQKQFPTTLVLREASVPRKTTVHLRGDFLRKGEPVSAGFPRALVSTLTKSHDQKRLTRLQLAQWLVSAGNPLTARVTVNREWQKFFGRGLVETENDFGLQGSFPTHPELLDYLALEFRDTCHWSLKSLHRLIVLSATYRQASHSRADLTEKDPRNLLLARQTRLRLEAEVIRDAALCASGLFNPRIGGPGVYPPQPKEVFSFTQTAHPWNESRGADRYRRGMYTFIWRQSQHPLLTTFDAADAQTACTRRNRSNTPLQALHLANDPVFVELARGLGERIEREGPSDDAGKLILAFRICLGREPSSREAVRLRQYLDSQRTTDSQNAWTAVARVLLNLDEFITRE